MKNKLIIINSVIISLLLILILIIPSTICVVPQEYQVLVVQFGNIKRVLTKPGLYFKIPAIQRVLVFEKRILNWDGDPEQIPTKDKKYIWVDTTARWQIVDVVKFARTVQNEYAAQDRLDGILDGAVRDTISNYKLVEAVRNSNKILDDIKLIKEKQSNSIEQEGLSEEDEIVGEIENVYYGREALSQQIVERAKKELEPFGINLIDVQIRSIAYESSVQEKVYQRMIAERERIAEKIKSYGQGEAAKIKGKMFKDLNQIESEAYKKSQIIKGTAESKAIAIYADAIKQNTDFYNFWRTLETYKKIFNKNTKLIISTETNFLKLFNNGK